MLDIADAMYVVTFTTIGTDGVEEKDRQTIGATVGTGVHRGSVEVALESPTR